MITLEPPRTMAVGAGNGKLVSESEMWRAVGLSRSGLGGYLRRAQAAVGLEGQVEVLLAGDRTVRRLNREFRAKDKATDVLSFPAAAGFGGGHAGDLAISLDTAERQAAEQGHSLRDEVRVLLLHGLLHLAGMDHEVDGGAMAEREDALRKRLGLKRGLIARVGESARFGSEKEVPRFARNNNQKSKSKSENSSESKSENKSKSRSKGEGQRQVRRKGVLA